MLHKGGMPVIAGEHITYETTKANDIGDWIYKAEGAIKILYPILRDLPQDLDCQIIWMRRDFKEQAKSQKKIRKRGGMEIPIGFVKERAIANKIFTKQVLGEIVKNEHFHLLKINFEGVLKFPFETAKKVNDFLGGYLDIGAMAACVVNRSPKNFNGFMEDANNL